MATIDDILKKNKSGDRSKFVPQKRRAWDYVDENNESSKKTKKTKLKQDVTEDYSDNIELTRSLSLLSGHQKKIIMLIADRMAAGENEILLQITEIAKNFNTSKDIIRISLKRLIAKGIICRLPGKKGRHGMTKIEIDKDIAGYLIDFFETNKV